MGSPPCGKVRCHASLGWHEPGCTQPVSPPSDAVPAFPWVGPHLYAVPRACWEHSLTQLSASCRAQCPGLDVIVGPLLSHGNASLGRLRGVAQPHRAFVGARRGGDGTGGEGTGGEAAAVTIFSWAARAFSLFFSGLKDFLMETATAHFFKKQIVSLTFSYF